MKPQGSDTVKSCKGERTGSTTNFCIPTDSNPPITPSDRADVAPLNNKGWGIYSWQCAPCQEIICCFFFFVHSAFSNSHLYFILPFHFQPAVSPAGFEKWAKHYWKAWTAVMKDARVCQQFIFAFYVYDLKQKGCFFFRKANYETKYKAPVGDGLQNCWHVYN